MQDAGVDLEFFFAHAGELFCLIGPDGRFSRVNPAWERVLGWSADQMTARPYVEFIHPADREATCAASRALAGAPGEFFVNRYRHRDGSYRWLEWRFGCQLPDGGIQAIARDITDQRQRGSRLAALEVAGRMGSWEIDLESGVVYWSDMMHRMHETDPADGPPDLATALSFLPGLGMDDLRGAARAESAGREGFSIELPLVTARGNRRWVTVTGAVERSGDKPVRAWGTMADTTAERARRIEAERLGAVARHSTNGVLVLDPRRRIVWANPAYEARIGLRLDQLRGRRPIEVMDILPDSAEAAAALGAALDRGEPARARLGRRAPDGAVRWVDINVVPVPASDGTLDSFVSVENDITDIHEREARLAALGRAAREARDRLIAAVEALPDAFVLFDRDDRLVLCNSRYREFYAETAEVLRPGVRFEEIERFALARAQLPDAAGREEEWLRARMAGRAAGGTTLEQRLPDGRILRTVERRTASGELVAFHADITELRRSREAAIEARNALAATLDAIPDLLFEVAADGTIVEARDGRISQLREPTASYVGRNVCELVQASEAPILKAALADAIAGVRIPPQEYQDIYGDWHEVTVALKATGADAGTDSRLIVVARNASERKMLEQARARNEAALAAANAELNRALAERDAARTRFEEIAAVSSDWFWEQDAHGRFTYVSESIRKQEGLSPEMHLGRTREELIGPENMAYTGADWDALAARIAALEPFTDFVYRMRRPSGRDIWLRSSGAPFFDAQGAFAGYRGVGSNVTALYEARLNAEDASAAKSRFLASMSHEIRTPLNGIMGVAAVLEDRMVNDEDRALLRVIRESGESLVTILNDILDFSKIEAKQMTLDIGAFSPADLLRRMRSLHAMKAREKGITLRIETEGNAATPREGDIHRLLQVLHNLVGNAIKFTDRGEVCVTCRCTPDRLAFEISDTGIGMTRKQADEVFSEFVQADSSISRRFGGTGLGLSITRQLVGLMGGTLAIDSALGRGTRVRIDLPAPMSEAASAVAGPQGEPAEPLQVPQGLHVLVADDNATNRLLLGKFLEKLGVSARVVDGGGAAVAAAAEERFDMLLLDISMPDMTGLEALEAIRAADRAAGRARSPAVAVTANAMHHQVEGYLAAGFDAHVSKPLRLHELARGIITACEAAGTPG